MNLRQKDYYWLLGVIGFYILTGYLGMYGIWQGLLWPIFAVPLSLFLARTGQKEIVALTGIVLAVVISFLEAATFNPAIVISFLIFIVAPIFVFGSFYNKRVTIPWIIMMTTIVCFFGWIVFLGFSKLLRMDYLDLYFTLLDVSQEIWNDQLELLFSQDTSTLALYKEFLAQTILVAKRVYPATLFIISLVTSTIHLLIVQLVARIRSWRRPAMKEILSVGLSPVAAWVLIILWVTAVGMGDTDTIWTFATESMLSIFFFLFQIIGLITVAVMIMKIGTTKMVRIALSIISMLWLMFNPTLLVAIGCLDSMFNFRKAKTLI